ncbi:MAG TPA: hypothetical protein VFY16_11285, partial [Gemmatimonadaceae bacterium]|nr:hypothetical protein [Gemmatimonadaceae bacterium]
MWPPAFPVALPRLSWPPARERRTLLLVGLLALTFLLTAVLAYQAQDAARSHRRTAERTLRDYADYAAVQYAIHAKEGIYARVTDALYGRMSRRAAGGGHAGTGCAAHDPSALYAFRMELPTRWIADARGCAPAAVLDWLRDSVARHAETHFNRKWEHADIVRRVAGEKWLVAYSVGYDAADRPVKMYGFATRFGPFAAPVLRDVARSYPLLPPALAGAAPADSLLSVVVTDGAGTELYRSAPQYASAFTGSYGWEKFGGMAVSVALRSSAADRLVIGGLPRSRLPLLLGLTALTGMLVVVAFFQLRREAELSRLR